MKIAGIEIPKRLEFGNEDHIKIARTVERRLNLLSNGMKCCVCGFTVYGRSDEGSEIIKWLCGICGNEFNTNLDGE